MTWIVIPRPTALALLGNPAARTWIARRLPDDLPPSFIIRVAQACFGSVTLAGSNAAVLGVWSGSPHPMDITGTPILSIWHDPPDSAFDAIADEERSEFLERICQLAERSWNHLALPPHWEPKKIADVPSVFAGDRQLKNIRVAYLLRSVRDRSIVDIGTVYYARRTQKPIRVVSIDSTSLNHLPPILVPPAEFSLPAVDATANSGSQTDDRDVVITLPEGESRHLFSLKYPEWMDDAGPLTKEQRKVIRHKIQRPLRIHGPAGAGKTLVLILRTLRMLREAQEKNEMCHILFVVNSKAIRATIRTAIEAIDDRAFLATSRKDKQFLDVETLHGWCIRELGLEHGPRYVLEEDPIVSKDLQRQILGEVVNDALDRQYPRGRLSPDLIARIEGERNELLRNLAWEVAIRIKGRGFRRTDQDLYVGSTLLSFIGRNENEFDRHFIFYIYTLYEDYFAEQGLLDTDDVILSMAARLSASLWDRQRRTLGYDYVMVDETHLFNENERRVLPYLSRGTTQLLPLVMTFDEAQSIGGRRGLSLEEVGIRESEKRTLTSVHRSSPDIFALARDLVERGPLVFSEFLTAEPTARASEKDRRRTQKPGVVYADGDGGVLAQVIAVSSGLRSHDFRRVGVIIFGTGLLGSALKRFEEGNITIHHVRERGELAAALSPGIYVTAPEDCGGLEFDGVVIAGVDEGRVPPPIGNLSAQGSLVLQEEAFIELYTAITRAKYRLVFISDRRRGLSPILRDSIKAGLIEEGVTTNA